jgi:transcriptional regulator with XRE-family HTH domain
MIDHGVLSCKRDKLYKSVTDVYSVRQGDHLEAEALMAVPEPTFAEVFERLRQTRGLSPAQLARELDEYEGNISRWRRGQGIDHAKVRKVADYFGVDRGWLERLAGYGDSTASLAKERIEVERGMWAAVYDELIETKVPRAMWRSYIDACIALARAFEQINPAAPNAGSAPPSNDQPTKNDDAEEEPSGPNLSQIWAWHMGAQHSDSFVPSLP